MKPQKSFGINGSSFICYPSEITIEVGGHRLTTAVQFSSQITQAFPAVLDQEGFFGKARISFERYKWNLDIRFVKQNN